MTSLEDIGSPVDFEFVVSVCVCAGVHIFYNLLNPVKSVKMSDNFASPQRFLTRILFLSGC